MSGWSRIGARSAIPKKSTRKFSTATPRRSSPARRRRESRTEAETMNDSAALAAKLRHPAAADRITPAELAALAADVFGHCGVPRADAEIAAEVALWAQLHGSDSHGLVHRPL